MTIQILNPINISPILEEYQKLKDGIVWTEFPQKGKQTSLQYKEGEDPWTSSINKSRGQEMSFSILNPFFKDTIFEKLIQEYNLKRTRFMWIYPWSCYSVHKDLTPRIHIPIITNPQNFIVFKYSPMEHLSLGNVYWVDTTQYHTAINGSDDARLHLVGIVEK